MANRQGYARAGCSMSLAQALEAAYRGVQGMSRTPLNFEPGPLLVRQGIEVDDR